jgi:hypothetical protein
MRLGLTLLDGMLRYDGTVRRLHVASTGSRYGMTEQQLELTEIFALMVSKLFSVHFHHGDCVGSDLRCAQIFNEFGHKTYAHPGHIPEYRANHPSTIIYRPDNTLERNKIMAKVADIMFAAPKEMQKQVRGGGTWTTIKYANALDTPGLVFLPDGTAKKFSDFK